MFNISNFEKKLYEIQMEYFQWLAHNWNKIKRITWQLIKQDRLKLKILIDRPKKYFFSLLIVMRIFVQDQTADRYYSWSARHNGVDIISHSWYSLTCLSLEHYEAVSGAINSPVEHFQVSVDLSFPLHCTCFSLSIPRNISTIPPALSLIEDHRRGYI